MFDGLHDIDWSQMEHAYGTAEEVPGLLLGLASPDEKERREALGEFYGAVHHQGDVYRCTAASVPFLFELAADVGAPGRAAVIELLVSIGRMAVESGATEEDDGWDESGHYRAAVAMRERAGTFVRFVADPDRLVRQAAIPALGLFVDDAERAVAVLRERLPGEPGVVERLLLVEAMATLALRRPEAVAPAREWLAALAEDRAVDPSTRLAALVQHARCTPEFRAEETTRAAIALLRESVAPADDRFRAPAPATAAPAAGQVGVPAHVIAAFEDLKRESEVHSPLTDLLRAFHEVLGDRVAERTMLLTEQLRSGDPGARLDALRMSRTVVGNWRGDHGPLVALLGDRLTDPHPEVVAEAAAVLNACHPVAEPARPALAALVAAQRAQHGPQAWDQPQPDLRRAHQEAVLALAQLGDERALPGLLAALDGGADAWRAVQVAGCLPGAAGQLAPRVAARLLGFDQEQEWIGTEVGAALRALGSLGGPAALAAVGEVLDRAVWGRKWDIVCSALAALQQFGPAAAPALPTIRRLATLDAAVDLRVAPAAVAALQAAGADPDEVLPLLLDLLDSGSSHRVNAAVDVLAAVGPAATAALPRLRELLDDDSEWVRVRGATALWAIGGEPEAPAVLGVLLPAWEKNSAVGTHVARCLDRMGPAAAPAVPALRAQLDRPARNDRWFGGIEADETLQRICRAVLARLASPGTV
ncbi:HEAT repeat domain-containing protein [Kitasatospora sp. NPDC092948]|uniref:HEAT repeat domain-containing protein n=1 Tax=Kitasatospora sp. NPDC092948 TaxID=3364088 RepID=UPI0038202AB4